MTLIYIITTSLIISLGSFSGLVTLILNQKILSKILIYLVSFSAGIMIGSAFLHLIPEASETLDNKSIYLSILISFIIFFIVEKILHWHHCHKGNCDDHALGRMNLIGDSIHNFLDGLIIAAAFLTDTRLGITTGLAIALHEIPQEISDFGVLLYSGMKRKRALILNFLVANTTFFGALIGYFFIARVESLTVRLIPFAAGGFIYIAASDLMPEIRKEKSLKGSIINLTLFLLGNLLIFLLRNLEG